MKKISVNNIIYLIALALLGTFFALKTGISTWLIGAILIVAVFFLAKYY